MKYAQVSNPDETLFVVGTYNADGSFDDFHTVYNAAELGTEECNRLLNELNTIQS